MDQTWLTCEFVEELEQAARAGRPVTAFVEGLKDATLPALLEYGCARWQCATLPQLPNSMLGTPLGRALSRVKSQLGLRAQGTRSRPPRTIAPEPCEFHVLDGDGATMSRDWGEFLVRLSQSAKSVGFSQEKARGIAAALGEMADNAIMHARSPVGALVGYQAIETTVVCSVADVGIGVLASLRENNSYRNLTTHTDALRTAFRDGVTRNVTGGGFGFRSVFKALTAMRGALRFRSGQGCVTMDGTDFDADRGREAFVLARPGFQVTISCRGSEAAPKFPII